VGNLWGKENALRGSLYWENSLFRNFPAAGVVGTCGGGIKKSLAGWLCGYHFFLFFVAAKSALKIFNPSFLLLKKLKNKTSGNLLKKTDNFLNASFSAVENRIVIAARFSIIFTLKTGFGFRFYASEKLGGLARLSRLPASGSPT
jgi:hypothetical protein